jgi:hypothetical protein
MLARSRSHRCVRAVGASGYRFVSSAFTADELVALSAAHARGDASAALLARLTRGLACLSHTEALAARLRAAKPLTGSVLASLASRLVVGRSDLQLIHGNIVCERLHKTFAVAPTEPSGRGMAHVFEIVWQLERSLIPRLLEPSFEGRLTVSSGIVTSAADLQARLRMGWLDSPVEREPTTPTTPVSLWTPAVPVLHLTDSSIQLDVPLWQRVQHALIPADIAPGSTEQKPVPWFIAFASTHPTDFAFDEISRGLFGQA